VKAAEWEKLLLDATERVMVRISAISAMGSRGTEVGTGASGDTTILADKAAEDELLKALLRTRGVRVLTEEAGLVGDTEAETLAVLDPLDGSSNFERGIPFFCTSVAIVEGKSYGDIAVGVVRDLVTGDAYAARKGSGARKNGHRIDSSGVQELRGAVVALDLSRTPLKVARGLAPLASGAARIVHYGANALELCYLADGRVDAFVDLRGRIRVTDFAAAGLIAAEAGATVTGPEGRPLSPSLDLETHYSIVASASPALHRSILRAVSD
jgi:myo-inositol-1(or 4)-monophosphatase